MKRASGVLLPITSLPSPYGIGSLSKEAYEFVDQLVKAGQRYWQILPLGPTGYGDSPYQSFSTFAGSPYLIDLDALVEEGLLTKEECAVCDLGDNPNYVDYEKQYTNRMPLLMRAYKRSKIGEEPAFQQFVKENEWWLKDYALYMGVKKCFKGLAWSDWAQDIRLRWGYSLDYYYRECAEEIEFREFLQFKFYEQWSKLKKYANKKGIRIIGDLPIYVAFDSADAWAHPQLFQFDEENYPVAVAGVPPDAFSDTGQLWGNPLYRWDYHRGTGFEWWISRMRHAYQLYDVVRIDHFRGFDEYFSVPYGSATAASGRWEKGPGLELFNAMKRALGERDLIAEDLGVITPSVEKLVRDSGFPNMRVLEFGFEPEEPNSPHMPHQFDTNCVVYTGTHDNETLVGWYRNLTVKRRRYVQEYLRHACGRQDALHWDIIRLAMMSSANLCVFPLQDILARGNEARMNHPSTLGTNWQWRVRKGEFTEDRIEKLRQMTEYSYRLQ